MAANTASYPLQEKLKQKVHIDALFATHLSVSKYPLRLVYAPFSLHDSSLKMGVSVSKRYFKKATDRNYYKRVLRECYRKHKSILIENQQEPHVYMLLYQTKDRLTFAEVEQKVVALFEKMSTTLQNK